MRVARVLAARRGLAALADWLAGSWPGRVIGRIFANPVLMIELRRSMRGRRPVVLVTSYLLLLMVIISINVYATSWQRSPDYAKLGESIINILYWFQIVGILLIIPGITATAITREREQRTYDLIRASLLRPGEILIGKLLVAISLSTMLVIIAMPLYAVAFLTGGAAPLQLAAGFVILILITCMVATFCLVIGVELRKSMFAIIVSYLLTCWLMPVISSAVNFNRLISGMASSSPLWRGDLDEFLLLTGSMAIVAAILLSFARERLAGWRQRGRLFRFVLPVLLFFFIGYVIYDGNTTPKDQAKYLGAALVYLGVVVALFGLRPPHAAQRKIPYWKQLLTGLLPHTIWKEDTVTFPFYLCMLFTLVMLVAGVVGLFDGDLMDSWVLVPVYIYGLVQILFWSGLALALGIWLWPKRIIGLGTVLMLVLLIAFSAGPEALASAAPSLRYVIRDEIFSPIHFFGTYIDSYSIYNNAGWGDDEFYTDFILGTIFFSILTILVWSSYAVGWWAFARFGVPKRARDEDNA